MKWLPAGAPELYLHAHLSEPDVLVEKGGPAASDQIDRELLAVAGELTAARLRLSGEDAEIAERLPAAAVERIVGNRFGDQGGPQLEDVIVVTSVGKARVIDSDGNLVRELQASRTQASKIGNS
jgi:hypothetical protein